jgi:hypothetical protein
MANVPSELEAAEQTSISQAETLAEQEPSEPAQTKPIEPVKPPESGIRPEVEAAERSSALQQQTIAKVTPLDTSIPLAEATVKATNQQMEIAKQLAPQPKPNWQIPQGATPIGFDWKPNTDPNLNKRFGMLDPDKPTSYELNGEIYCTPYSVEWWNGVKTQSERFAAQNKANEGQDWRMFAPYVAVVDADGQPKHITRQEAIALDKLKDPEQKFNQLQAMNLLPQDAEYLGTDDNGNIQYRTAEQNQILKTSGKLRLETAKEDVEYQKAQQRLNEFITKHPEVGTSDDIDLPLALQHGLSEDTARKIYTQESIDKSKQFIKDLEKLKTQSPESYELLLAGGFAALDAQIKKQTDALAKFDDVKGVGLSDIEVDIETGDYWDITNPEKPVKVLNGIPQEIVIYKLADKFANGIDKETGKVNPELVQAAKDAGFSNVDRLVNNIQDREAKSRESVKLVEDAINNDSASQGYLLAVNDAIATREDTKKYITGVIPGVAISLDTDGKMIVDRNVVARQWEVLTDEQKREIADKVLKDPYAKNLLSEYYRILSDIGSEGIVQNIVVSPIVAIIKPTAKLVVGEKPTTMEYAESGAMIGLLSLSFIPATTLGTKLLNIGILGGSLGIFGKGQWEARKEMTPTERNVALAMDGLLVLGMVGGIRGLKTPSPKIKTGTIEGITEKTVDTRTLTQKTGDWLYNTGYKAGRISSDRPSMDLAILKERIRNLPENIKAELRKIGEITDPSKIREWVQNLPENVRTELQKLGDITDPSLIKARISEATSQAIDRAINSVLWKKTLETIDYIKIRTDPQYLAMVADDIERGVLNGIDSLAIKLDPQNAVRFANQVKVKVIDAITDIGIKLDPERIKYIASGISDKITTTLRDNLQQIGLN